MTKNWKKAAQVLLFFGIGFLILYLVFQNQNKAYIADCALKGIPDESCSLLQKVITDMQSANYFWIVATMVLFMVTNVFRALRWKMMLEALDYRPRLVNLFGTIMINYLANLGIPRSGELIRAGLLSNYEDIPVEKVLGTIVTDRIFDVICLALVLFLTLLIGGNDFYYYLNANMNLGQKFDNMLSNPLWLIIISSIFLFTISGVWVKRKAIVASPLGQKVWLKLQGFIAGIKSVKTVSSLFMFIFYTLGIWIIYYLMLYISFFAFAPTAHLGPIAGLVVFAFGSLGILFPSPGGMGSYHMLVGEGLSMYGINGSDAFSFANIVFFSISVGINLLFGIIFLILLPIINKR